MVSSWCGVGLRCLLAQVACFALPHKACEASPVIAVMDTVWTGAAQLVRQFGLLRRCVDGICALLDEHCAKLSFDTALPRRPCLLEQRSLRQQCMTFADVPVAAGTSKSWPSCGARWPCAEMLLVCRWCTRDPRRHCVPLQQSSRLVFLLPSRRGSPPCRCVHPGTGHEGRGRAI